MMALTSRVAGSSLCLVAALILAWPGIAIGQSAGSRPFQVDESHDRVELVVGSQKRLEFPYHVPEVIIQNDQIVRAIPASPNAILLVGVKPGVSSITVSDPQKRMHTIVVNVIGDVRGLELAIANTFPESDIRVVPMNTGIWLTGTVARADQIDKVAMFARDFFPTNVINDLQVCGSQLVAIEVQVYEISRTKLRQLGIDWGIFTGDTSIVSGVADLVQSGANTGTLSGAGQTISFGVFSRGNEFLTFIRALERNNVAKLLDQPTLVATNGRPAEFLSGGEVPVQVASGLGTTSVEFRPFGTKLDFVPLILGHGRLRLEIRAEVSELASDLGVGNNVPGFRVRRVNTGVEMNAGHTLALAGDYREIVESEVRGIPGLIHMPVIGPWFRRVEDRKNEVELLFLITPRFIHEVDPAVLPAHGPGRMTANPGNRDLYHNGHIEVPRCCDDCPVPGRCDSGFHGSWTVPVKPASYEMPGAGAQNRYPVLIEDTSSARPTGSAWSGQSPPPSPSPVGGTASDSGGRWPGEQPSDQGSTDKRSTAPSRLPASSSGFGYPVPSGSNHSPTVPSGETQRWPSSQ